MTDNSPATELLPCPFCGGTDLKIWDNCVTCNSVECSASGPDLGHCTGAKCRAEAIKLWNIRAETAKNSGEVAAATDGKQIVTMAEEGAWQAAMIGKGGGPWSGTTLEALIDQYANGIYIGKISKPPLSVCVEHLREFATKLLALATPANSRSEPVEWKAIKRACVVFCEKFDKGPFDELSVEDRQRLLTGMRPVIEAALPLPLENARHAKNLREVATILSTERIQGWANPLVCVLLDAEAALRETANSRAEAIGAAIRIKPPEWRDVSSGGVLCFVGHTLVGRFAYGVDLDNKAYWQSPNGEFEADTMEAAKAATQADYEQRIRSALLQQEGE